MNSGKSMEKKQLNIQFLLLAGVLITVLVLLVFGCDEDSDSESFTVTSTSFDSGEDISEEYCHDDNVTHDYNTAVDTSPQFSWSGVPSGTESFVLIIDDSSAGNWAHWVLYYIPSDYRSLAEGLGNNTVNCLEGIISSGATGYEGPYPPDGDGDHTYYFRLYALDTSLDWMNATIANRATVLTEMDGHILDEDSFIAIHSGH